MGELNKEKLEQYYNDIVSGKITLTEAAGKEGISNDYLKKLITEQIQDDESRKENFRERLYYNKYTNSAKDINEVIMTNIRLYLLGKITIQDASAACDLNEETFKNKMFDRLSQSSVLLELYLRNGANKRDYSQLNTRLIIINMLKNDMTQSEMSRQLQIPSRTISSWIEKLPQDDELRKWAKDAAYRAWNKIQLSQQELEILNKELDRYIEENQIRQQPIDTRSLEERELEKVENFLEQVYKLEAEIDDNGKKKYTRKQIMSMLVVGSSAIRRAEIKRDKLKLIIEGKKKQEERGV